MKKNRCLFVFAWSLFACLQISTHASAAESALLWQIGKPDNNNAEFALAPNGYGQFKNDGFFVMGESDAKRDWPYVHPGPHDGWAGAQEHTFTILFGLKTSPGVGECQLQVDLLDTQSQSAPRLRLQINGQPFERNLPRGAGDATVFGDPSKGKEHKFNVAFPSSLLKAGDNEIRITTLSGSWVLYDWLGLQTPAGAELAKIQARTLVDQIQPVRALQEKDGKVMQPVRVVLRHFGDTAQGVVRVDGAEPVTVTVTNGEQTVETLVPAAAEPVERSVQVEIAGKALAGQKVILKPVRKLTVYILPHSHTDIGYTEIQTAIEKKQVQNLVDGMQYAQKTAGYPAGARFIWNVEVLWAADLYLRRLDEKHRSAFFEAVKKGQVALCGMYLNELTGLCRPEELVQLFRYSTKLGEQCGVTIDSAMISDVPGYTWGTVPAMAQAGIKYFSVAPNYFDRIGNILQEWENKPFYWVGPDGRSKVLVWIPFWGYAMSHRYGKMSPQLVEDFCDGLEKRGYPYDIAHVRWSGHGDNAVPDPAICEFVRDWNTKYTWPKFVIASTSDAFRALEEKYGDKLPLVRGDWTPYWEDGAGSSALETAMNRASSDRLVQAQTLFAMFQPNKYPAAAFEDAWNSVLLYSEHTWGADCSVSEPERRKTTEQWEIKQSYAAQADQQSRALLSKALAFAPDSSAAVRAGVQVLNTLSWPRTELVLLSKELSAAGDRVADEQGRPTPSQRLTSGELAFLAREVPPFAARRFSVMPGNAYSEGKALAEGAVLNSGAIKVRVDEKSGGIAELTAEGVSGNFVDSSGGETLNDYLYLPGDNLADLKRNGPVTIKVGEKGPLVASLIIESDAPGCKKLRRELRVVANMDYVEVINTVDKARLQAKSYHAKEGKESVNFAFPFNVPDGDMVLDLPLGVMRPEADQMPSACKNWLTVGRWAEVANRNRAITWVTLDAPLVQLGGLTATLLNSQANPDIWRKKIDRTQKIYAWAMNNHWGTNYRAYQEGPTVFRFVLRPRRVANPAEATRFATAFSQPLLTRNNSGQPRSLPWLRVSPDYLIVTALKPSDDNQAIIVRLFNSSGAETKADLSWPQSKPKQTWLSDTSEKPLKRLEGPLTLPAWGLVTLRLAE